MTICIAAICAHEKQPVIVCCSDTQGTYGDFIKSEDEYKFVHLGRYSNIQMAGFPSNAKELAAAIKPALYEFDSANKTPADFDLRINTLLHKIRKRSEIIR